MFYGSYPIEGGSGGGVTSIDGITGAVTLVGAGGISILDNTPSPGDITIDGSGLSTIYALRDLSNLTPTAINQSLIPNAPGVFNLGSTANFWTSGFIGTLRDAVGNVAVNVQSRLLVDSSSVQQASWSSSGLTLSTALILDGSTSGAITQKASAVTTPYTVTWPNAQGTTGQVLTDSDGAGTLTWTTPSTAASSGPLGAVQYSDGAGGFLDDDTDFHWDDTGKLLQIGPSQGGPGTVPFAMTVVRSMTDATAEDGTTYMRHNSFNTTTNSALNTALLIEAYGQVDTGVSTAANAGVIFQAYRNNGSSDLGSMAFLVGAFGGAHQIGTGVTATTDLVAGVLSQVDMSSGIANRVADFYGLSGTNSGGTINTGTFGIYIEPPSSGSKDNWLSGHASVGGSTFVASTSALEVAGVFGIRDVPSGFQVSFAAPTLAASTPYILPATDGANGDVLTTDGAGNLSFAPVSATGFANTTLSNLVSPTAINQDLIFDEGTLATLKTKDDVVATQDLTLTSGTATVTGISGNVNIQTGTTTDTGSTTGAINLNTGAPGAIDTNSGGVISATGDVTGVGQSGIYQLITGGAVDSTSGSFTAKTGRTLGAGSSGPLSLGTGNANGTGGTGISTLQSGDVAAGAGVSGDVVLHIGTSTGTRGNIRFTDGSEGTAGYVWTSTDTAGAGAWMPASTGVTFSGFAANLTTNTTAAGQLITYDATDFNTGTQYNTSTGVWTVPTTGYYEVSMKFGFTSQVTTTSGLNIFGLWTGSVVLVVGEITSPSLANQTFGYNGSNIFHLTSGSTYQFIDGSNRGNTWSGGTVLTNAGSTPVCCVSVSFLGS